MVNLFLSPLQGECKALPPGQARQQRPLWREGSRKRMQIGAGGRGQPRGQESSHMGCSPSSLLWLSSRSVAPLEGHEDHPPEPLSVCAFCSPLDSRAPGASGGAMGKGGGKSLDAGQRDSAPCVPRASGPWQEGSLSQNGRNGRGDEAQRPELSVPQERRRVSRSRASRRHACCWWSWALAACCGGPRGRCHRRCRLGAVTCRARGRGRARLPGSGSTWDAQRWGRPTSLTHSSSSSLRA